MTYFYVWLIVGVIFLAAEMFTVDFSLACVGLSFMAMAVPAYFGFSPIVQALVFTVVGLILYFALRPFAIKFLHRSDSNIRTNADAIVGRKAVVFEDIDVEKQKGSIKIDGDILPATAKENIAAGVEVTVEKLEGIVCTVKKL